MLRRSAIFSLLDQLASASGLFLFTVLVSRSLSPGAFGLLSVTLAWGSLLGALLQPALIDSSTVLGARAESGRKDWGEVAIQSGLLLLAATAICSVMAVACGVHIDVALAATVAASEVAVSLSALLRRFGYACGPAWLGVALSLSNLAFTASLVPICMGGAADVVHALYARLLINALTAVPAGVWLLQQRGFSSWRQLAEGASRLLHFSRAYVGGSVIFWITNSLQVVFIGHALSMSEAAGYRAAQLLVLPVVQLQAAIFQLVMPRVVSRAHGQHIDPRRELPRLCAVFGLPALFYALGLAMASGLLLELVFGKAYAVYRPVVVLMGCVAVLDALKQVAVTFIYAQDRKSLFMQYRIWALALFACGVAPALWWGNLMAFVLVNAITSAALLIFLFRQILRSTPEGT